MICGSLFALKKLIAIAKEGSKQQKNPFATKITFLKVTFSKRIFWVDWLQIFFFYQHSELNKRKYVPFPLSHILETDSVLILTLKKTSWEIAGINTYFEIRNSSQVLLFQTNESITVVQQKYNIQNQTNSVRQQEIGIISCRIK